MKELLINFYCMSTSKSYDFWISGSMTAESAVSQVCDTICEFEKNKNIFADKQELILCSFLTGKVLPASVPLELSGIKSGDKLVLA